MKVINSLIAAEICSALCFYAKTGQIHLEAFVVMLDHWHAVFATTDGKPVSKRMSILDSWISKQTREALEALSCFWQVGFHETAIRSAKQFRFVCGYIEENPVRARLVRSPSDWVWSSLNPVYSQCLTRPWPWRFERD